MKLATDIHNFFEPPSGYVYNKILRPSSTIELDFENLFFLGDNNARGDTSFTQSTVDDLFISNIEQAGIKNELAVVKIPVDFDHSGKYYSGNAYLVINGMRRGIALDTLRKEGRLISGVPASEYKVPCIERFDVDIFDESSLDSAQLSLNDQKSYTSGAISSIINKYLKKNYRPIEITKLLGISKQYVNYYSKIGKDRFATEAVEENKLSVNAARQLMSFAKETGLTTEEYFNEVQKEIGDREVTPKDLHNYYTKISPNFNPEKSNSTPVLKIDNENDSNFLPQTGSTISESSSRKTFNKDAFKPLYEAAKGADYINGEQLEELLKRLITGISLDTEPEVICENLIAKYFE